MECNYYIGSPGAWSDVNRRAYLVFYEQNSVLTRRVECIVGRTRKMYCPPSCGGRPA